MKVYCKEIKRPGCYYFTVGKFYDVMNSDSLKVSEDAFVYIEDDDGVECLIFLGDLFFCSHTGSKWYIVDENLDDMDSQ